MRFFKNQLLGQHGVTGWRVERWDNALERYKKHFEAISSHLPVEIIQFHRLPLHDLVLHELEWVAPKQLRLRIGWFQVFFIDVRSSDVPVDLVNAAWLHCEVHLSSPKGFELQVLFDGGGELCVCALGLSVYDTFKRTWIIGKNLEYRV
jgi:hypothetical protein